jgi:catechol 2,3-dioxygenase-like lactoylglutathione lyase family enzyme
VAALTGNGLAYVAVVVRDVEAVARTLARDFALPRFDCAVGNTGRTAPVFPLGQSTLALFEAGDPFVGGEEKTGVHHIALAVEDTATAAKRAKAAGVQVSGPAPDEGLGGARRVFLSPGATAGVRTYMSEPLALERGSVSWVERIDHIGVACLNNAAAIEVFSRRLGYPIESTQTDLEVRTAIESFTSDKYGVVYHSRRPEIAAGLRVAFVTIGDCDLEFLQNFDPGQGGEVDRRQPGSTRQDQGAITRYIGSRGPGLHHIALKVPDIDRAIATLTEEGHSIIDTAGRPGSRRAKIGFIHPSSLGGLLVHLVQRDAA